MKNENLDEMKTGEVAQRARKAGVKGVENMNKQQMIQAMSGGEQPQPAKPGRGGGHSPKPPGSKPQDWKNIPGNQS